VNQLADVLRRQAASDLQALPAALRARLSASGRVERCGSIDELRAAARRAVPRVIFDFVDGGANDEVTVARNRSDFAALELLPRVLTDVSAVDTATTVLGVPIDFPLLSAPMGLLALLHPQGEVAIARALHALGSVAMISAMASYSAEEMAELAPGPLWFQLYVWRDRGFVRELIDRALATGFRALVVTVDVPRAAERERDRRNGFGLPPRATLRSLAGGAVRPRWAYGFARRPRLTPANAVGRGGAGSQPVDVVRYLNAQFDSSLSWDHLASYREQWPGPLVVKGILHPDDARRAVDLGADAILVSNHGGRQLDHAISTIAALPAIVDAVGGDAEVYLDGGVRRGGDILKALALGARACVAGRPFAYGLAAGGEAGALRAATILRDELRAALALAGCPSIHALDRGWLRART
jgi:L-lactate dehydrogenase (cytochrome)